MYTCCSKKEGTKSFALLGSLFEVILPMIQGLLHRAMIFNDIQQLRMVEMLIEKIVSAFPEVLHKDLWNFPLGEAYVENEDETINALNEHAEEDLVFNSYQLTLADNQIFMACHGSARLLCWKCCAKHLRNRLASNQRNHPCLNGTLRFRK